MMICWIDKCKIFFILNFIYLKLKYYDPHLQLIVQILFYVMEIQFNIQKLNPLNSEHVLSNNQLTHNSSIDC